MHNYHLIIAHMNSPIEEYSPPAADGVPPDPNEVFWRIFVGEPLAKNNHIALVETPGQGLAIYRKVVSQCSLEV
jgi:hypothetical protein